MMKKLSIFLFALIISLTVIGCQATANWEESDIFLVNDRQMIGEEGRFAILYDVLNLYPDAGNKCMWYLWGDETELQGTVKVTATHEKDDESITLIHSHSNSLSPHFTADDHMVSELTLPKSGMWKLDAFIDDELFESIFLKIHEK
ncbi:hypothetical protein [Longirhabdus pacifica]|uniref:hypothetical protein n=1 Tax=Longirhabdus pacifica TaxID=2305227 RepID=UPI001008BE3C|nr:hypothetical protein [Longirhabdus pacifica]